ARGAQTAFKTKLLALAPEMLVQISVGRCRIARFELVEQTRRIVAEIVLRDSQYLRQARRKVGPIIQQVPIPQSIVGAACRHLVALFASAEVLVRARAPDCTRDEGGSRL